MFQQYTVQMYPKRKATVFIASAEELSSVRNFVQHLYLTPILKFESS